MGQRGRPPKPLNPDASAAAKLGAERRTRRVGCNLTLEALASAIGFSMQHISSIELAKAQASPRFVAACEDALGADGALRRLLPAALEEQTIRRHERNLAREDLPPLRFAVQHCDVGDDEDVEPTNRRGLMTAGSGAAIGVLGVAAVPAAARDIDPETPTHWAKLLDLLGRHDGMFGAHDVLDTVRHQVEMIATHRQVARGEVHQRLLREEARWSEFAAWLGNDTGRSKARDAWLNDALQLAREAGYPDMMAYARSRQSQWAAQEGDARRAIALAEAALRTRGASTQIRAWCALRAAIGHALAGDAASCERSLAHAYGLVDDDDSPAPPWAGEFPYTATAVRAGEARCWLLMQPRKAIELYDKALRDWPRDEARDGGVHQARLALACATAGELDRAKAEGRRALTIARATKSATAKRELKQVGAALSAA
jgi:transcriptional regulator with XRE-family HTH domain